MICTIKGAYFDLNNHFKSKVCFDGCFWRGCDNLFFFLKLRIL